MPHATPEGGYTIGVEEEYHLLDARTFALRPRSERVLPPAKDRLGERVTAEINESQVEVSTPVCSTLDEARAHLVALRQTLTEVAATVGTVIAATGTHPFTDWIGQSITPGVRYEQLEQDYQQLAREQLVCGCHVHVAVPSKELGVHVMDRVRPWLAVLRALTANSPYWQGVDTGYSSYRWAVFRRWPTTGAPPPFNGSLDAYNELIDTLVKTAVVPDPSFLYWDLRPSTRFPTIEFRMADVCTRVDDAVMLAGLCRSLVRTAVTDAEDGVPIEHAPQELLEAAAWRASRYGLASDLIDVPNRASRPAPEVVRSLLACLRPDLEAHGEWDEVSGHVERVLRDGNGADLQRRTYAETDDLTEVARRIATTTASAASS